MIHVQVPDDALVEGEIYTTADDPLLLEDGMLHVLVAGYSIDVSWYPEHDLDGEYVMTIYRDLWENKVLSTTSRFAHEMAGIVERWANQLSEPVTNLPSSDSTITEEYVYSQQA